MFEKSQKLNRVGECLYRNANKAYFAIIKVAGKQIKRSLKTDDLAIAKRRLAELRGKAQRLHGSQMRNIRFDELADVWLESIKPGLKPASWDRRRVALVGLRPFFRGVSIKSLNHAQIDEWRIKRGAKLSARSYNIELETLKMLLRYACERGILLDNYAENLKRLKQPKNVPQFPTRQQFLKLVAGLRSAPKAVASGAADMVEFLAYSGARVGEAREVKLCDINFENRTLLITGGALRTKNQEQRTIPLFPDLRNLFRRMFDHNVNRRQNSNIFTIKSPRGAMRNACERMGLEDFNVHSLRHFFVSNAVEHGINFKVISDWIGHSDGGVLVARTYGHLRSEFSAEMAERMSLSGGVSESASAKE
jgi:integrase